MGTPDSMIVVGTVIAFVLISMLAGAKSLLTLARQKHRDEVAQYDPSAPDDRLAGVIRVPLVRVS